MLGNSYSVLVLLAFESYRKKIFTMSRHPPSLTPLPRKTRHSGLRRAGGHPEVCTLLTGCVPQASTLLLTVGLRGFVGRGRTLRLLASPGPVLGGGAPSPAFLGVIHGCWSRPSGPISHHRCGRIHGRERRHRQGLGKAGHPTVRSEERSGMFDLKGNKGQFAARFPCWEPALILFPR